MLSQELRAAVKLSRMRQYEMARVIKVHPSTLSGWMCGIYPVRTGDPRIVELGRMFGLSADRCFADPKQRPTGVNEEVHAAR